MILKVLCGEEMWPRPRWSTGSEWPPVIDNISIIIQSFLPQVVNCLDPARHVQCREGAGFGGREFMCVTRLWPMLNTVPLSVK